MSARRVQNCSDYLVEIQIGFLEQTRVEPELDRIVLQKEPHNMFIVEASLLETVKPGDCVLHQIFIVGEYQEMIFP